MRTGVKHKKRKDQPAFLPVLSFLWYTVCKEADSRKRMNNRKGEGSWEN